MITAEPSNSRPAQAMLRSAANDFLLAVWFGAVGGLVEGVAHWTYQATPVLSINERLHPVDLNVLWTSPLVDIVLFVTVACLLLPIFLFCGNRDWQLPTIVFTALVCNGLLVGTGRVRMRGSVVLAIGLGTVAGRWVRRNPDAVLSFFRRSLFPLLCVILLTCGAVTIGTSARRAARIGRLPTASPASPNILLIVLDTLRADRLGAYGYMRPTTPFLDEYARRGVLFEQAFANTSWTMPSHASIFTGRFPFEHGVDLWPYDGRFPTLAQILAAHGYVTAGFSSNEWPCTRASGLGVGFTQCDSIYNGPLDAFLRSFYGRRLAEDANTIRSVRLSAQQINSRFLHWIDGHRNRPFFAFLNYMEAHETYNPPIEYLSRFSSEPKMIHRGNFAKKELPVAYDASVAYLDAQLQQLFNELSKRSLDGDLLVIIAGDHGQSLGEHGLMAAHGINLYLEEIHVPLMMVWPGKIPAGVRVPDTVGLQAIAGTIAELTGVGRDQFPGGSLPGCWTGGHCGDGFALSELNLPQSPGIPARWMKSLITANRHFILQRNGTVELYDWRSDPAEQKDLAADPSESSLIEMLGTKLAETIPAAAVEWDRHAKTPLAAR